MTVQVPCRTLRHLLPLRCQSHWIWFRGRTSRAAERVPQVAHPARGGGAGAQDAEAGHGGEAGQQERAAGERYQGQGFQDLH